jgi:site-specific recombinase XerD
MKTRDLVAAFLNAGQARGLAPGTIVWYRIILGRFSDHTQNLPRKPEPVEDFLSQVHVSARTRQDYYKALSAFFSWCEKRYGVTNPLRVMTPPKSSKTLPRTLSSAEIGCLFLVPLSKRDRALVSLLLDTGVRIGEAMGLEIQDLGPDSIMVDGKTGPRDVPISPEVRSQLVDIAGDRYVFEGDNGHLTTHTAYYTVRKAFLAAGIRGRKLGPHTMRHTFGRHFIMAGGDAFSLQRILGHSDIQTTRIYVELNTQDIIRQHHKYTPIRAALAPTQGRLIDEAESIIRTMKREDHG